MKKQYDIENEIRERNMDIKMKKWRWVKCREILRESTFSEFRTASYLGSQFQCPYFANGQLDYSRSVQDGNSEKSNSDFEVTVLQVNNLLRTTFTEE